MKQVEVLSRLRNATVALRALGALHLFLFGSTARDTARPDSDVDIFIDRNPEQPLGLMGLAKLEAELEAILGTPVDVTTRGSLHPLLRASIEQQAIQVF